MREAADAWSVPTLVGRGAQPGPMLRIDRRHGRTTCPGFPTVALMSADGTVRVVVLAAAPAAR